MVVFKVPVGGGVLRQMGQKRCYFEKRTREVIDNKQSGQKTNPNEPKNEAGKLLKIHSCGKNEPKNEPGHVVENK
jgi:hypothetical protein